MRPLQAVILAAGMGTRLQSTGHRGPKGALILHERPIITESINRLLLAGIETITLVTGYQADFYDKLAESMPASITRIHNPAYAASCSMYSLYLARESIHGAFLLRSEEHTSERKSRQ